MDILCVYYSAGGNTRFVLDEVADVLNPEGFNLVFKEAIIAEPGDLDSYDHIMLACPTYDHGLLSANYYKFIKKVGDKDLKDKKMMVVGLGDNKYDDEHVCEAAKILEEYVVSKEAELVHKPLRIVKSPVDQTDRIREWAQELVIKLK